MSTQRLAELVRSRAITPPSKSIPALLDAIGNAKVVLIGEMTHGTEEFYRFRAELTKELISKKGFTIVAIEGDWPDVYRINRYVQQKKAPPGETARTCLDDFKRFPRWMWRNTVMEEFVAWLRDYNDQLRAGKGEVGNTPMEGVGSGLAGIYGLDLYSLFRSAEEVINYLDKVDPKAAEEARRRYGTLDQYRDDEHRYGYDVAFKLEPSREKEVLAVLLDMIAKGPEYIKANGGFLNGDEYFYATENAHVVRDAERYYRHSMLGGAVTWNLRDTHMADTLAHLFKYHEMRSGTEAKAVIWAHNSHVGDARATAYTRTGEYNIGQLIRQRYGREGTYTVGFTTYNGTVMAAQRWGGEGEVMTLNDAGLDTYEAAFHVAMPSQNFTLIFRRNTGEEPDKELVEEFSKPRYERMIGVQYVKRTERQSHYIMCKMPSQFDAVIHFDQTNALTPL